MTTGFAQIQYGSLRVATFLIALLGASIAHGQVPDAIYHVVANGASGDLFSPGTLTGTYCNTFGCQTSTASALANLSTSASGTSSSHGAPAAIAAGTIEYNFEVIGPIGEVIPLHITGNVSTFAAGEASTAIAQILYAGVPFTACSSTVSGGCNASDPSAAALSAGFSLPTDVINSVFVSAQGNAVGGSFNAFADPVITIDSGFLALHPGLSLVFSSNVVSAVPEPTDWLLLSAGLGVMLGWRKTHRRPPGGIPAT